MWAVLVLLAMVGVVLLQWLRQTRPLGEFMGLYAAYIYTGLWHRVWTNGPSGFPAKGAAIVVSNHVSSPDGICILHNSPRLISWVAAREHYRAARITGAILDWMHCVPVTRGGQDPGALRTCLRRLAEGRIVGIFPEGGLTGGHLNRTRPGQGGAAYLALRTRAPVFPVFVAGGPRSVNLLETWVHFSRGIRLYYGKPVDLSAYYDRPLTRQLVHEVTLYLMSCIQALRPGARGKKGSTPQKIGRAPMSTTSANDLTRKHCVSCEGGVPPLSPEQVRQLLGALPHWKPTADGKRIRREWRGKNFTAVLDFFNRVGQLAEEEGHHPDLHLTNYRDAAIEIWTHAIGGLSENDFILAAKIDQLPVELKQ